MNSLASNPSAASMMAHQMIDERVRHAQDRAQARAARQDRRTVRRSRRLSASPPRFQFDLPLWAFRYGRTG
jgi:hypothetical protein